MTKTIVILFVLIGWGEMAQTAPVSTDDLINQLPGTDRDNFGFSILFNGLQFVACPHTTEWTAGIPGTEGATLSGPIVEIVQQGAAAIPALIAHLDDSRPTKIKLPDFHMFVGDEYDYNKRTRQAAPEGVNQEDTLKDENVAERDQSSPYVTTVGDLCFLSLGQIVNRNFFPSRGQPTLCIIINSPTSSARLLAAIRAEYGHMTPASHKEQLLEDVKKPDSEWRRNGAVARIAYYYPEELDRLVLWQIEKPTYDTRNVDAFIDLLKSEKDPERRKQLFNAYVKNHGPSYKEGILRELFMYLRPIMIKLYDPRELLIQLFGYSHDVTQEDAPYIDTWTIEERARFIEALGPTSHPLIDAAIYRLFLRNRKDSYTALRCIETLKGRVHNKEFIEYCKNHLGSDVPEFERYREVLKTLDRSFAATTTTGP